VETKQLRRAKLRKTFLIIGGVASSAMAAFHFVLPHVFGWVRFVGRIPAPIRWGLFSINVFFSTLLLWGGVITIISARNDKGDSVLAHSIVFGMGLFWIVNVLYQVIYPFPHEIMRWVLLGFSISVAVLYVGGVILSFDKSDMSVNITTGILTK
jgi:hypothetical protein